jgi:general secretion pathway protein I
LAHGQGEDFVRSWRAQGFSLLEMLVAFSILALSLGILMRIFSGSLGNVEAAHDRAQAVVLAQSLLASAGITSPLVPGEISGEMGGKFHWTMHTRPYQDQSAASGMLQPVVPDSLSLWEVEVEVRWGELTGVAGRSFSLSSLRIQQVTPL